MVNKKYIGTIEAAKYCGVSRPTFRKWIDDGLIDAFITPGGTARISIQNLISSLKKHNMPIPDELMNLGSINKETIKVLLLDNDNSQSKIINKNLKVHSNFKVISLKNAFKALLEIGSSKPDILIIDSNIPEINVVELLKELKENPITSKIKTMIIIDDEQKPVFKTIEKLETDYILSKPLNIKLFRKKITTLADNLFT
jgi:excisionase family DNA binding protein